jgi:glycosyltransferase involved in cell wall biosynthesis
MPVYNGEKYVAETIQSVLSQTYSRIEIIVQDNASTDGTRSILQEIASKYSQIYIERNEQNCGMSANWNLVINRSRGNNGMLPWNKGHSLERWYPKISLAEGIQRTFKQP